MLSVEIAFSFLLACAADFVCVGFVFALLFKFNNRQQQLENLKNLVAVSLVL